MLLYNDYVLLMHMLCYNKFDFSLFHLLYSIQHMHYNKIMHVYDDLALMKLYFDLFQSNDLILHIHYFRHTMQAPL